MPQPQQLSLAHLVRPAQAERPPLLVLLHGYGSNEHDLFGLAPYLDPRFLLVSARAPFPLIMEGFGWASGYGWFELGFSEHGISFAPEQVLASRDMVAQFIGEAIVAYHADSQRVYLLGFSQGAIIAASVLLQRPDLLAGVVLMSGSVPSQIAEGVDAAALAGKPILVTHGLYDPVVPIVHGRTSRDVLSKLPVDLTYHEYPMAHEVSLDSLTEVSN